MNLGELFPGVEVAGAHLFRVIRDTDMEIREDGADDLLESVDRTLKQLRHGALSLLQVEATMPQRVLNILVENFEIEDDVVTADAGPARLFRLDGAAPAAACRISRMRPSRRGTLWAGHPTPSDLRRDPRAGLPRPPPVRFVLRGRDLPPAGGHGPARRRHQDDALPDRRELAADRSAHRSGRRRQAGGGAGRAEGAVRRAQQHQVGERAWKKRACTSSTASRT